MKAIKGSPALKYLLVLALGIHLADGSLSGTIVFYSILCLLFLIGLSFNLIKRRHKLRFRKLITCTFLTAFGMIGYLRNIEVKPTPVKTTDIDWCVFEPENDVSNEKWNRWEGKTYDSTGAYVGKARLSFPFQSGPDEPGQRWAIKAKLSTPTGERAPMGFDYKTYLNNRGIHLIGRPELFHLIRSPSSLRFTLNLQKLISQNFKRLNASSRILMKALLLGDKSELGKENKAMYSRVGIMHVLAVSGLHVGLIYNLLSWILRILPFSIRSIGRIFIIPFIWIYAGITGFSPSVSRASSMISLLALGQVKRNSINPINILSFVGVLLLIIHPKYIYAVGFQLSFMAVFGILIWYPKLKQRFAVNNKFFQIIIDLSLVSIAAQLFTAPLAIHYFHQFPTYFLFANILIVPIATVVIQFGILFLIVQKVNFVSDAVLWILELLVQIMNFCISFFDELPYSSLSGLFLNTEETVFCYLLIFIIISMKNIVRSCLWAFIFMLTGSVWVHSNSIDYHSSKHLIVMDNGRDYSIAFISERQIHFSANTNDFSRRNLSTYVDAHNLEIGSDLVQHIVGEEKLIEIENYLWCENETMNFHFHKEIICAKRKTSNKVFIPSLKIECDFPLKGWMEIEL